MNLMADEQSNKYEIPIFLGFNQAQKKNSLQPGDTITAQNMVIDDGDLSVTPGFSKFISVGVNSFIKTLMAFYKNNNDGTRTEYLLAASETVIYKWNTTTLAWDVVATGLLRGWFDYLNYQKDMTDLIIVGNGYNDTLKWDGVAATFVPLLGSPPKFRSIALHYERLWATGDTTYPDRVYYSADLDPENWTISENGAGFIDIPTWNNDVCIGIIVSYDDVVIFKTKNIFKIVGTYPGEYQKVNIYSTNGAIAERSMVIDKNIAFFLSKDGIYTYDGTSTSKISFPIDDVVASMNLAYANVATGIFFKNKYIIAIPTGSSTVNDTVIEFDTVKQTFIVKKGINVNTFIEYDDKLLFGNDNLINGKAFVYQYNVGTSFDGTNIVANWETPDTDWNSPDATKTSTYIYFNGKGNGSIQIDSIFDGTTKGITVPLSTTLTTYRKRLRNKGKRFKFKFSNVNGSQVTISNPKIYMDVDYD